MLRIRKKKHLPTEGKLLFLFGRKDTCKNG